MGSTCRPGSTVAVVSAATLALTLTLLTAPPSTADPITEKSPALPAAGDQQADRAAPATEPPSAGFSGETSVLVVEVPVRVVRRGRPVAGLTRDDFEIYDRGEQRELVGFEVVDRSWLYPAGDGAGPAAPRSPIADRAANDVPRHYLLLFDFAYAGTGSLGKALAASRELVEGSLGPDDQVAVAFFSALRGVRLLADFTDDRDRIGVSLDLLQALLTRDSEAAGSLYDLLYFGAPQRPAGPSTAESTAGGPATAEPATAELATAELATAGPTLASRDEVVAEASILVRSDPYWPHRSIIRDLTSQLAAIAWHGAELPGLRTAIYFSSGFDSRLLTNSGSVTTLDSLEELFQAFRAAGWTMQTINVGGHRAGSGKDTLFFMAHETGGESFENFNDVGEAMSLMLRKTSVTYLLAFRAEAKPHDGRFRRLDVRLTGGPRGARVVHRPGYALRPPDDAR